MGQDNNWRPIDLRTGFGLFAPNEVQTWPGAEGELTTFALTSPVADDNGIVTGSLDDIERGLSNALEQVRTMRASAHESDAWLREYLTTDPVVWLLDDVEPGLMYARLSGDMVAEETAVCWEHVDDCPAAIVYDEADEDDEADPVDCSNNGKLSCSTCGYSVADWVTKLSLDPHNVKWRVAAIAQVKANLQ